jgi:hypothetical protein
MPVLWPTDPQNAGTREPGGKHMHAVKQNRPSSGHEFQFFCKLFDDMIATELCYLRRTYFLDQNLFSCRGCSKDTILSSPHRLLRQSSPR